MQTIYPKAPADNNQDLLGKVNTTLSSVAAKVKAFGEEDGVKRGLTRFYQGMGAFALAAGVIYSAGQFQKQAFQERANQLALDKPYLAAVMEKAEALPASSAAERELQHQKMFEANEVSNDINAINGYLANSSGRMNAEFAQKIADQNPYLAALGAAMEDDQKSLRPNVPDLRYPSDFAENYARAYPRDPIDPNTSTPDGLYWSRVVLPGGYSLGAARDSHAAADQLRVDLQAAGVEPKVVEKILDPTTTPEEMTKIKFLPSQALALARIKQQSDFIHLNKNTDSSFPPLAYMNDHQKAAVALSRRFDDPRVDQAIDNLVKAQYAVQFAAPQDRAKFAGALKEAQEHASKTMFISDGGTAKERVVAGLLIEGSKESVNAAYDPAARDAAVQDMKAGVWEPLKQDVKEAEAFAAPPKLKI